MRNTQQLFDIHMAYRIFEALSLSDLVPQGLLHTV